MQINYDKKILKARLDKESKESKESNESGERTPQEKLLVMASFLVIILAVIAS